MRRLAVVVAFALASCEGCEGGGVTELVPVLTPSAGAVSFGDVFVGATGERLLTLSSTGTAVVEVSDIELGAPFDLEVSETRRLNPGDTLEVTVRFSPSIEGAASAVLSVASDAVNGALAIPVNATAVRPLECPNENPCVEAVFDPEIGACVETNLLGPCDDESACTEADTCVNGRCLGEAISCPAAGVCFLSVCAEVEGCIQIPDPAACDDGNPCTANLCDPVEGCTNPPLADGVPCGVGTQCENQPLCFAGECTDFPVPDGVPCSDGDVCTVDDVCEQGECVGLREERDPEIVGTLELVAPSNTVADATAFVDERRAVVVNVNSGRITLVEPGDPLTVHSAVTLGFSSLFQRLDGDTGRAAVLLGGNIQLLDASTNTLTARGTFNSGDVRALALSGQALFICRAQSVDVVDVSDLNAPALSSSLPSECSHVDASLDAVVVTRSPGGGTELDVYDRVGTALTLRVSAPADAIAAAVDDGRVIYETRSNPRRVRIDDLDLNEIETLESEEGVTDFAVSGDTLVVTRLDGVTSYDLSQVPATSTFESTAITRRIRVSVDASFFLLDNAVHFHERGVGSIRTGLLGPAQRLFDDGARLVAASSFQFREIDVTDVATPVVGPFSHLDFGVSAIHLGASGTPLVILGLIPRLHGQGSLEPRIELRDANAARLVAGGGGGLNTVSSGSRALQVELGQTGYLVSAFDAAELVDENQAAVADSVLIPGPANGNFFELAASSTKLLITNNSGASDARHQVLVDISGPTTRLASRDVTEDRIFDTAVADNGLSLVLLTDNFANFSGTDLVLLAASGDETLVELDRLDVSGANHITTFDGRNAILTTSTGIAFVDVTTTLDLTFSLETTGAPLDATFFDDKLVVTNGDTIEVVTPPCPPE